MYIDFIHYGFNCNSSSTHSLLITEEGYDDYESGRYGWDHFTVSSIEAKNDYLATLFAQTLSRMGISDFLVKKLIVSMYNIPLDEYFYIDHQSVPIIPYDWNEKGPDASFWFDFERYIKQKDLVIIGGNDNEDEIHPLDKGDSFGFPNTMDNPGRWVARVDGDFWTLYNRSSGNRIRFSFLDNPRTEPSVPDLVDMKITDYCSKGCDFCYMSSSENGEHASYWDVGSYLYNLSQMRVFEVAFGGGEPTSHPDFFYFLKLAKNYGIVPNFTTRNIDWIYIPKYLDIVKSTVGKFAYSVNNSKEMKEFISVIDYHDFPHEKVSVQVIDGVIFKEEFELILRLAYDHAIDVTLLGYKYSGRGNNYTPLDTQWKSVVESLNKRKIWPRLSVDTSVAKNYDLGNTPRLTYYTEEGRYSMYIDAVNNKCGVSSFTENLKECDPRHIDFRNIEKE